MNLDEQLDYLRAQLEHCELCPRKCGVDRLAGRVGFCGAGAKPRVASLCLHRGEEPPISGDRGSGTIFFSGCTMKCVYCQNYPISQMGYGNDVEVSDLVDMMLKLQRQGAHNINLVTATHFLPQTAQALIAARVSGLTIPVVSNTSGYERVETIRALEGLVQVYMVDMRYSRAETAARYSQTPDYPEHNRAAIYEMFGQVGPLECRNGLAVRGVMIRHLILPGLMDETREILQFIASELPASVPVSLMTQYFPANKALEHPEISRKITSEEYQEAIAMLDALGLDTGWVQDPETGPRPVT
jgi:putative pyruvate formate lyase activating enzyme